MMNEKILTNYIEECFQGTLIFSMVDTEKMREAYFDGFWEGYRNPETSIPAKPEDKDVHAASAESESKGHPQALLYTWNLAGKHRGQETAKAQADEFLTESMSHYSNSMKETFEELYPFADKRMAYNPFKRMDKVVIPKGTKFTTTAPGDRAGVFGRKMTVEIHDAYQGYTDGGVGKRFVRVPTITYAGSGGYWKTVNVTPELLEANGMPLMEQLTHRSTCPLRPSGHYIA